MAAGYRVSPALLSSDKLTTRFRCLLITPDMRHITSKHKQQQIIIIWGQHTDDDLYKNHWLTIIYFLSNFRLYSARCSACQNVFTKNDFVMRAKTKMFHLECFRCAACRRHLGQHQHPIILANSDITRLWTICRISSSWGRVRSSRRGHLLQGGSRAAGTLRGQQQPGAQAADYGQPQADQDRAGGLQGQPQWPRPGGGQLQVRAFRITSPCYLHLLKEF